MHGIDHDESKLDIYGNEFPPYLSKVDVRAKLSEASQALSLAVGRPVPYYMPPRNRIDTRTAAVLNGLFESFTAGPETDTSVLYRFPGIMSEFPHEYGRTDEMFDRDSHTELIKRVDAGRHPVLTLHWTWETSIGLDHMRRFLSEIPREYFTDFD